MILILSQDMFETTTELVMDWIVALGGHCVRLNGEDLTTCRGFTLHYDGGEGLSPALKLDSCAGAADDFRVVWLRRWQHREDLGVSSLFHDQILASKVGRHLVRELAVPLVGLRHLLRDAYWLSEPKDMALNKLRVLSMAAQAGLDIPRTIITNRKEELQRFKDETGRIITKALGEATSLPLADGEHLMYTAEVEQGLIDKIPDYFFPSLFQELLEKRYELRIFFLNGKCYPMAIFSQMDDQTSLDFRRYNETKPNRTVPYHLPDSIAAMICLLMSELQMDIGSIDFVRTRDGRFVFLEVNPIGQFGMVSYPCNYYLERRVAEHLIQRDSH